MQITINQKQIDFTLENEKTLEDVIFGVQSWLDGTGFIITDISADKTSIPLNHISEKGTTPIEDIGQIDLTVQSSIEAKISLFETLFEYFNYLHTAVSENDLNRIKDLITSYSDIKTSFSILFSYPSGNFAVSDAAFLDTMIQESGILDTDYREDNRSQILTVINQIKTIFHNRIRELANPLREVLLTARLLKSSIFEISDVSVLLQTGKDRQAMNVIIKFSELSQKIIRLYPILKDYGILNEKDLSIGNKNFTDFYQNLNSILSELLKAFEANDSVLIGDLLEYEIAPQLEELIRTLESLNQSDNNSGDL